MRVFYFTDLIHFKKSREFYAAVLDTLDLKVLMYGENMAFSIPCKLWRHYETTHSKTGAVNGDELLPRRQFTLMQCEGYRPEDEVGHERLDQIHAVALD